MLSSDKVTHQILPIFALTHTAWCWTNQISGGQFLIQVYFQSVFEVISPIMILKLTGMVFSITSFKLARFYSAGWSFPSMKLVELKTMPVSFRIIMGEHTSKTDWM